MEHGDTKEKQLSAERMEMMTLYNFDGDIIQHDEEQPILVHIRYNPTDEVRLYKTTGWFTNGDFGEFIWSEGNYSCDCNRCLFFRRVKDEDEDING